MAVDSSSCEPKQRKNGQVCPRCNEYKPSEMFQYPFQYRRRRNGPMHSRLRLVDICMTCMDEGYQLCPICQRSIPLVKFYYQSSGAVPSRGSHCVSCNDKAYRMGDKYGIGPKTYLAMLEGQKGGCAICRRGPGRKLHVDHCHESARVRGLLCALCNQGLGHFKHDPALLRAAALYIEEHAKRIAEHQRLKTERKRPRLDRKSTSFP
jgi:hypothetical protein